MSPLECYLPQTTRKEQSIAMAIVTHSQRYLPHTLDTKYHAVKLYRSGHSVSFVCRRYHISKSSLMRWNKRFDGTRQSLTDGSHKPRSPHPNAHTDEEIKWIKDYHRRTPSISDRQGLLQTPRFSLQDLRKAGVQKSTSIH